MVIFLAWMAEAAEPSAIAPTQAPPTKVVVVDDFESYTSDQQLDKTWYKPPHGGETHQSREATLKDSKQKHQAFPRAPDPRSSGLGASYWYA